MQKMAGIVYIIKIIKIEILCKIKIIYESYMKIPSNYQKVQSMPDDPPWLTAYMTATSYSEDFALVYSISFSARWFVLLLDILLCTY